jgi:hypothetical protein
MTPCLIIAAVLCATGETRREDVAEKVIERMEIVELNRVADCGAVKLTQWIFWARDKGELHIVAWRMVNAEYQHWAVDDDGNVRLMFDDGDEPRTIEGPFFETEAKYDREVMERKRRPEDKRVGLRKPKPIKVTEE